MRNYLNHRLADGIRRVGFRKWYERELISSHAHMVLALLSTIGLLASFEAFSGGSLGEKLLDVIFIVVCAGITMWALRRYLFLLLNAEEVANQANCPNCKTYGRLKVSGEDARNGVTGVVCQHCGHEWTIDG